MNDCPTLDGIMSKERRLIKLRKQIAEEKAIMIKTKSGKLVRKPYIPPKPMDVGISRENGIPTRPRLDFTLKRRKKRKYAKHTT
ncbi:MAG: hypothetical protein QW717_06530 [Candidatus Bathyarchaeia archaeon]